MSKKKNNIDEQNEQAAVEAQQPTAESGSPAYVSELMLEGTTILTAKTREELAEMVNQIPADCSYMAGAVGRNFDTGMFTLRIDLTQ